MAKTRELDNNAIAQRARDARAQWSTAKLLADDADSANWKVAASCSVLAGIAAADAICGRVLGYCSSGDSHAEAIKLLERATSPDRNPANDLQRLLNDKSLVQYGTSRVTETHTQKLLMYAQRLIDAMDARL